MSCPTIVNYVLADIFSGCKYYRHLITMRIQLAKSMHELILAIARYFPAITRIFQPQGGYVLWVELPLENLISKSFDTYELTLRLLEEKIAITPGKIFTTTQKYKNCLRLSSGGYWTPRKEKALKRVGELIKQAYKN